MKHHWGSYISGRWLGAEQYPLCWVKSGTYSNRLYKLTFKKESVDCKLCLRHLARVADGDAGL